MPRLAPAAGLAVLVCFIFPPASAHGAETVEGTLIVLNKAEATASLIDLAPGQQFSGIRKRSVRLTV